MNEEEAIKILKTMKESIDKKYLKTRNSVAMETVLNLLEKKGKMINTIKEYAQQEIDFATEDIEDYIDDDREDNKDMIGALKEWREHWKDIIRIMNNEKTYMDYK